jgi:plasmid stability protein
MATLTIRNVDDDLRARLRQRAARHGRSMEAEVRAILADALTRPPATNGLGTRIAARFAGVGGVELEDLRPRDPPRTPSFDR